LGLHRNTGDAGNGVSIGEFHSNSLVQRNEIRDSRRAAVRLAGGGRVARVTVLLFFFGVVLAVYGLVEERDLVVVTGGILAATAVALNRVGDLTRRRHERES